MIGISAPSFWLALMAVALLSKIGMAASEERSPHGDESLGDLLIHLLMPAVTLGVAQTCHCTFDAAGMLEQPDRMREVCQGKGKEFSVVFRHAQKCPAGLVPVLGLQTD